MKVKKRQMQVHCTSKPSKEKKDEKDYRKRLQLITSIRLRGASHIFLSGSVQVFLLQTSRKDETKIETERRRAGRARTL